MNASNVKVCTVIVLVLLLTACNPEPNYLKRAVDPPKAAMYEDADAFESAQAEMVSASLDAAPVKIAALVSFATISATQPDRHLVKYATAIWIVVLSPIWIPAALLVVFVRRLARKHATDPTTSTPE